MTLRAFGATNGVLPEPTDILVAFMRDPAKAPHLRYTQMIPAPDINFIYFQLDPDDPVRLTDTNSYAWGYDDYRPTGRGFTIKVQTVPDQLQRWDFPWEIGNNTVRMWQKSGINIRMLFDRVRANHAQLHRSVRIVTALQNAAWPAANTGDMNTIMGTAGAGFDLSSGQQYQVDGTPNPNFQIIRKFFSIVHQRIHLSTNAGVNGEEMVAVIPPKVARAMAYCGEMTDFLKQSPYAERLIKYNYDRWALPDTYAGFTLVVEDTPRCFINQNAAGVVANVTVPSQKDYILDQNAIYFVSRPGGLDGEFGGRNYSTVQCYHFRGEARVEAFDEPKHDLIESHVVMEDKIETPALIAGFYATGVVTSSFQAIT